MDKSHRKAAVKRWQHTERAKLTTRPCARRTTKTYVVSQAIAHQKSVLYNPSSPGFRPRVYVNEWRSRTKKSSIRIVLRSSAMALA